MKWFLAALPKLNVDIGDACTLDKSANPFFGFPKWWKYFDADKSKAGQQGQFDGLGLCVPKVKFPDDIWAIGFAVVDMMLYAAGILAVIFIIVGGVTYMTAEGSPEKAASARKRIFNAVLGLVIVLMATVVVSFLGRAIG